MTCENVKDLAACVTLHIKDRQKNILLRKFYLKLSVLRSYTVIRQATESTSVTVKTETVYTSETPGTNLLSSTVLRTHKTTE